MEVIIFFGIGFNDFSQRPMEVTIFFKVSGLMILAKDLWKL